MLTVILVFLEAIFSEYSVNKILIECCYAR